ncbi:MAG: DUF6584 family protein [Chloroflexota bacterium]|nr:MAG: hypothetical protein DLM70_15605 [Chloroflexota bacterium]
MSKETTLRKIDEATAAGDHGAARDRLQGLLATYPADLSIRKRLGEVYWRLGNPSMAGRYWYLEEGGSDAMVSARAAFERSCGNNAQRMLRMLKFKGDIETPAGSYAARTLRELRQRAEAERPQPSPEEIARWREWRYKSAITFYSCSAIAVSAVLLLVVGLIFVLSKYL